MSEAKSFQILTQPQLYIETVCLLNQFVEKNYNFDFQEEMLSFTPSEQHFIDQLDHFHMKGLEFIEFFLSVSMDDLSALNHPDGYRDLTQSMNHDDFLFRLFDGDLNTAPEAVRLLIRDIEGFRALAEAVLLKISHHLASSFHFDDAFYRTATAAIEERLKDTLPLQLCQELMGKRFYRVYDFKRYWFIPSRYYKKTPMRIFDDRTQILLFSATPLSAEWNTADLAKVLRVLGDTSRLEMIRLLAEKPWSGKDLASQLHLKTPTITHHLDQLRGLGLLHEERDKNTKYVSLNRNTYRTLCRSVMNLIP